MSVFLWRKRCLLYEHICRKCLQAHTWVSIKWFWNCEYTVSGMYLNLSKCTLWTSPQQNYVLKYKVHNYLNAVNIIYTHPFTLNVWLTIMSPICSRTMSHLGAFIGLSTADEHYRLTLSSENGFITARMSPLYCNWILRCIYFTFFVSTYITYSNGETMQSCTRT